MSRNAGGFNLSLPGVVMFSAGVVLIYCGVRNRDPRRVVQEALGFRPASPQGIGAATPAGPGQGGGPASEAQPPGQPDTRGAEQFLNDNVPFSGLGQAVLRNAGGRDRDGGLMARALGYNVQPTPIPGSPGFGRWVYDHVSGLWR